MTYENLMIDWNSRGFTTMPKAIIIQRGERESGEEMMVFTITNISKVILQLLKDSIYFFESECDFELNAFPDDYIHAYIKDGIDGGLMRLMDKDGLNSGDWFHLSFEMIGNLINKNYIKDIKLKYKAHKFYSSYENYCVKYNISKELNISKIKAEISGLSEAIRKQMIFDGQIRRIKTGLTFDEFLYWIYLMKPGDKFEINTDKGVFEIVEIKEYPTASTNRYNTKWNYTAVLLIKDANSDEIKKFALTQMPCKRDHAMRFCLN